LQGHPGMAAEELSEEDQKIIENLDILENLELLEEDLDLLENLEEVGEDEEE